MITARIGYDHFLVWRLPLARATHLLPPTAEPLIHDGHAWLLFAIAELKHTRVYGLPLIGSRKVAGWLIPCRTDGRNIGNFFLQALSNDPLIALAYHIMGMRSVRHTPLRVDQHSIRTTGVRATLGEPCQLPELAWFTLDRCGLIARHSSIARLPLVKRGWHWQTRTMTVDAPFATSLDALPLAAIDCSNDLALWGAPLAMSPKNRRCSPSAALHDARHGAAMPSHQAPCIWTTPAVFAAPVWRDEKMMK
jgi:hypothetical protein